MKRDRQNASPLVHVGKMGNSRAEVQRADISPQQLVYDTPLVTALPTAPSTFAFPIFEISAVCSITDFLNAMQCPKIANALN